MSSSTRKSSTTAAAAPSPSAAPSASNTDVGEPPASVAGQSGGRGGKSSRSSGRNSSSASVTMSGTTAGNSSARPASTSSSLSSLAASAPTSLASPLAVPVATSSSVAAVAVPAPHLTSSRTSSRNAAAGNNATSRPTLALGETSTALALGLGDQQSSALAALAAPTKQKPSPAHADPHRSNSGSNGGAAFAIPKKPSLKLNTTIKLNSPSSSLSSSSTSLPSSLSATTTAVARGLLAPDASPASPAAPASPGSALPPSLRPSSPSGSITKRSLSPARRVSQLGIANGKKSNSRRNRPNALKADEGAIYNQLLNNNKEWAQAMIKQDADYFSRLSTGQNPPYMLIGCSDSRVPPDQLTQTMPGQIFIHRNVANLVVNTDMNLMAVLQYAVEVLKVKHIIVMGHTECGGVRASMTNEPHGLIDKWLRNIKDVYRLHRHELDEITDISKRFNRLVELNVIEQVYNLYKTSIVQKAWASGHHVQVHGWVCDIHDGLIHDLNVETRTEWEDIEHIYEFHFDSDNKATTPGVSMEEKAHPLRTMRRTISVTEVPDASGRRRSSSSNEGSSSRSSLKGGSEGALPEETGRASAPAASQDTTARPQDAGAAPADATAATAATTASPEPLMDILAKKNHPEVQVKLMRQTTNEYKQCVGSDSDL